MRASVSVVIPCYCCAGTVRRALESVVKQTLLPEEVLLIDDGSSDGGETRNLLHDLKRQYAEELHITIIQLDRNHGPSAARNRGWKIASQPLIAFLDADDAWHPRKIEIQYTWMQARPDVAVTGHQSFWVRSEKAIPPFPDQWRVWHVSARHLYLSNRLLTRSVMLRREIPFRFDPSKRYSEDYLLWLKIVLSGRAVWRLELPLAYSYKADFGASGLTSELWNMEKGELDTYIKLYKGGMISFITTTGLMILSFAKYLRRVLIALVNRRNRFPSLARGVLK